MPPDPPIWSFGHRRLWIDETLNDMLALSEQYVAALGHSHIFVWRRADGQELRRFPKFVRPGQAWFVDTRAELCLRTDDTVVVCDLNTGAQHERSPAPDDPDLPTVIHDRTGYTVTLRWSSGHTLVFSYPQELIRQVSCARSGGRVAIGHGMTHIDIRDAHDGAILRTLAGAGNGVLAPDGRSIAVGDLSDRRVFIADVDAWKLPEDDVPNAAIEAVHCSPDGARVLVVAGRSSWILRTDDGAPELRLARPSASAASDPRTQWTADGAALVGPPGDQVVRWDARSGAVTHALGLGPCTQAMAFTAAAAGDRVAFITVTYPGGLMLIPGTDAIVRDLERDHEVARIPDANLCESIELAPDGRRLALNTADGVRVVSLPGRPGDPIAADEHHPPGTWPGFAADGLRLCELAADSFTVLRVRDGQIVARLPPAYIHAFAYTPDGRTFAVAGPDGTIAIHRGEDFAIRHRVQTPGLASALCLTPDGGLLIAGGWDPTVHAYRLPRSEPP